MRFCYELIFSDNCPIIKEQLGDLIEGHAYGCVGNHDDWDDEWRKDSVVIRFRRHGDAIRSARTFEQAHTFNARVFGVTHRLYRAMGPIYVDRS